MREILFKDLTSIASRKKDIFLKEVFERDGVIAKTERRCFYFIKDILPIDGPDGLQEWLSSQNDTPSMKKRHFYILKEHSDSLGEDKVVCKIAGTFYAVAGQSVYTIAFLHSFKACFSKAHL
jgi:hypothetical protein